MGNGMPSFTFTDWTIDIYLSQPSPGLVVKYSPEDTGLWLGGPAWRTLCWSRVRHSPRQLRVAAEVAFRRSKSWSKAVREPEPGRDSMACTRLFCCPSAWLIIYTTKKVQAMSGGRPFTGLAS